MKISEVTTLNTAKSDAINYLEIILHLKEGIAIIENGTFTYVNPAFCQITGCENSTLVGQNFFAIFAQSDQKEVEMVYAHVASTGVNSSPRELKIKNGANDVYVEITMTVLKSKESRLVLVTMVDVTAKRKRIDEIEQLNERMESILHSMHDAVISFSATDGSVISANPATELLFEIPLRDLAGATENDIVALAHPEDREKVEKFYRDLRENEFDGIEYRIVRNDSSMRWVRDDGYVVYCKSKDIQRIDHMIRDITEEKQAIRDLHRSEQKYKNFFHKTKDMAFSVSPDGMFLDINDAGINLLGITNRKEALSSNVYNFVSHAATLDSLMLELNEKGYISNKSLTLTPTSGPRIEVHITARTKKNELGEVLYYEGIATNITQALENQRNRVLRNTAAGMCHYLNSHLMHMSSALDGFEEELLEIDEQFMNSSQSEEKDQVWQNGRETFNGYIRDMSQAYKKISEITRAFNSAFLTYREEPYLDKTILDIFSTYHPGDSD